MTGQSSVPVWLHPWLPIMCPWGMRTLEQAKQDIAASRLKR